MKNFIKKYIEVELAIQKIVEPLTRNVCNTCKKVCCKEVFCRESIESAFLSKIVDSQNLVYNKKNGWLGKKGCELPYGRPLVCYEFFCAEFYKESVLDLDSQEYSYIPKIIKDFVDLGEKVYKKTHLICIDDLNAIPESKIQEMSDSLDKIQKEINKNHK